MFGTLQFNQLYESLESLNQYDTETIVALAELTDLSSDKARVVITDEEE